MLILCDIYPRYRDTHSKSFKLLHILENLFSLHWSAKSIQFISRNIRESPVCLCAPSWKTCFPMDLRLLIYEHIANLGIPLDIYVFLLFNDFLGWFFFAFGVFVNQPTLHNGGVSRWKVCGCGCCCSWQVTVDTQQMTHNAWNMTPDNFAPLATWVNFITLVFGSLRSLEYFIMHLL